jgi:acyl-CoA dehydrogenase
MNFFGENSSHHHLEVLKQFLEERIIPAEPVFKAQLKELDDPWAWSRVPILKELQAQARALGLWNAFLPGANGAGLTNLQYASLAELTGRSIHLAPAVLNCAAPDTGNMEVLNDFGTSEQKEEWLEPLLRGEIRSGFAMTEPSAASSDAANIQLSILQEGDHYVLNGVKWWTTGAMNPDCKIFIVMGKTNPDAARHEQQSQILVPRSALGLTVERGTTVFGYDDRNHGGHGVVRFDNVRVPLNNILGKPGDGFFIAQARLGPGRIHHCMRSIGVAEIAIEAMCERASQRVAFGKSLADQGVVRSWIAQSRVRVEQLRLLVLKTAWLMDTVGNKGAHTEIQAIKIATPRTVEWILDKAIQIHGGGGVSDDFPLAEAFAGIRSLRLADGPDEVHEASLAKAEIQRQSARRAAQSNQ